MKKTTLFEKAFKKSLNVRKNSQGLMGSKTRVHKDKKKESSKKEGRKKVEEDENTVGGGCFRTCSCSRLWYNSSGTPGTDAYAPGDYRRPTALGAIYSRKGKVGKKKRKTRKKKNKK
jgi:hypothetical protein